MKDNYHYAYALTIGVGLLFLMLILLAFAKNNNLERLRDHEDKYHKKYEVPAYEIVPVSKPKVGCTRETCPVYRKVENEIHD